MFKFRRRYKTFRAKDYTGVKDVNGNIIVPAQYKKIKIVRKFVRDDWENRYSNNAQVFFVVWDGANYGVYNSNGEQIIKCEFQKIKFDSFHIYASLKHCSLVYNYSGKLLYTTH